MKKSFGVKFVAVLCACVMCIGVTMTAFASANAVCTHPRIKQYGETVDHWSGSHRETFVESKGPETCTYTHWVDRISWVCEDCGTVIGSDTFHHENHSICGKSY